MWLPVMMYVSVHVVVVVTSLAGLKPANFFVLSTTAEKVGGIEDFLIGGAQFLICSTGRMEWMWHRLRTWGTCMCPQAPPPPGSYAYESILLFLTTNSPLCYYNYRNRDIIILTKMFANLMVVNGYFVKVYILNIRE